MAGRRTRQIAIRALFTLGLLIPGVLSPTPTAAQVGPSIVFYPTPNPTISPGGSFTVIVAGFTAGHVIKVDLVSQTDPNQITTLDTLARPGGFTQSYTLSTSVPADLYRGKASDLTDLTTTATTPGVLAIVGTGGSISGTASCPTFDPIAGTLVNVYSGADLVGRTLSGAGGSWAINGTAASSSYFVQYLRGSLDCSQWVTTNSDGFGQVPPNSPCQNPGHASWDDALLYPGTPVTAAICKAGQSFWVRVPINPGATFTVDVSCSSQLPSDRPTCAAGDGPKTRVELFKDLRTEGNLLITRAQTPTPVDVRQVTNSLPGVGGTDWDSSPWDSSDWDSSPWDSSPWDSSDWDSSPWDSSDWDSSPCSGTPGCTNLGNDGDIYSAAEHRSLLAISRHGHIVRNTWDSTGDFFIRVYNQDASFDPSQLLTVTASQTPVCGTTDLSITKTGSNFGVVGSPTTVILTDTARLKAANGLPLRDPSNSAALLAFRMLLNQFAQHAAVNGVVVDFADDPGGLGQDYAQWDKHASCAPAANAVSEAIHDLLALYRTQDPNFKYVTIVGGHTVVPYRLVPDYAEIQKEKRYNPGLLDSSESKATLASSYVMSDTYYASFPQDVSSSDIGVNVPEDNLSVGRLVETSDDITNVLNVFLSANGQLTPSTALATGYAFVKDLARFESTEFTNSGLTTDTGTRDAVNPDGLLISDNWHMPDLKSKIFAPGSRYDILSFNWHATTNAAVASDYTCTPQPACGPHPTVLTTADLAANAANLNVTNSLVLSIGCHLGYNLVNPDVIGQAQGFPVTDVQDFPQAFAQQGAMVLANTGYGYGDTDFLGYGERLLGAFTKELEYTDNGASVPVGLALTRAKRNYISGSATLTGVDRKTVEQLTFYGPPMWSVAMPTRSSRPAPNTLPGFSLVDRGAGLSAGDVAPPYKLTEHELGDGFDNYFSADVGGVANNNGTQTLPFRVVQPLKAFDASRTGAGIMRGVATISGNYTDSTFPFFPLTNTPVTEEPGNAQTPNPRGLLPFTVAGMNLRADQSLVVTPAQWTSAPVPPSPSFDVSRRYADNDGTSEGLRVRVYYSSTNSGSKALAGPLAIGDVAVTRSTTSGSLVHVDATITGPDVSGVADVLVTYTALGADPNRHWTSCNLVPGRSGSGGVTASCLNARLQIVFDDESSFVRHYSADIDTTGTGGGQTDLRLQVQAVSGTGLVSVAVNSGLYYQVKDAPTISSPKKATVLTLGAVTSPSPYDHVATFTATVKERNTGNPAVGKVEFSVGSQRQTVTLVNGSATTSNMVIQALPGTAGGDSRHYPMTATFIETQTLLPSSASADFVVTKKPTNVTFGATPFLATLTDADANRLRDEAIFFDIHGNGVSLTFTSQTGVDGVAQLRIPTGAVPAGTYTLTAYFLGKVPHDTGAFGTVTDDRYSASSATTTVTFDPSPPACDLTNAGIDGQGLGFIEVSVGNGNSGLVSVSTTELVNATVSIPSFANGVLSPPNPPLVVHATKVDQTQGSQLGLEVVNAAGTITDCDPVAVAVGGRGEPRTVTVKSVKPKEHFLVIYNGSPGIRKLQVKVNRFTWEIGELNPGEVRTLDIARALNARGTSTVRLTAQGSPNGHAMVLLSDITPPSAKARNAQPERSAPNEER